MQSINRNEHKSIYICANLHFSVQCALMCCQGHERELISWLNYPEELLKMNGESEHPCYLHKRIMGNEVHVLIY